MIFSIIFILFHFNFVFAQEPHLKNIRQLTFEGAHSEAYFSGDGSKIIFQAKENQDSCEEIYIMDLNKRSTRKITNRGGRNSCAFFMDVSADYNPDKNLIFKNEILFSSTLKQSTNCSKESESHRSLFWKIPSSFDIFAMRVDGTKLRQLTKTPGYDAESVVCGGKVAFTSARSGTSLQIYTMDFEGNNVHRLTSGVGYNGGPAFSPDCRKIVYRGMNPQNAQEAKIIRNAIQESQLPQWPSELFTINVNGTENTQLTKLRSPSASPAFVPKKDKIIFSTLLSSDIKKEFHVYLVDSKKQNQQTAEKVTELGSFNAFPVFSPDGKTLVFASSRNSKNSDELQLFLADWQE